MQFRELLTPEIMAWVVTPLLIFVARLVDVSIGTVRIILLSRGHRLLAPLFGFVEILIWLVALRQIFQHLDNIAAFFAYAAGFAAGTVIGMTIEDKLALGLVAIRLITAEDSTKLIHEMSKADFGVTSFAAEGVSGQVRLIFTIIRRKELDEALALIRRWHPSAFISISDVRSASEGVFPEESFRLGGRRFPGFIRKAK